MHYCVRYGCFSYLYILWCAKSAIIFTYTLVLPTNIRQNNGRHIWKQKWLPGTKSLYARLELSPSSFEFIPIMIIIIFCVFLYWTVANLALNMMVGIILFNVYCKMMTKTYQSGPAALRDSASLSSDGQPNKTLKVVTVHYICEIMMRPLFCLYKNHSQHWADLYYMSK